MKIVIVLVLACVVVAYAYPSRKGFSQLAKRLSTSRRAHLLQKLDEAARSTVNRKAVLSGKMAKLAGTIAKQFDRTMTGRGTGGTTGDGTGGTTGGGTGGTSGNGNGGTSGNGNGGTSGNGNGGTSGGDTGGDGSHVSGQTVGGSGHDEHDDFDEEAWREEMALAIMSYMVFADFVSEINDGYRECAEEAGHADSPLFPEEELGHMYYEAFKRLVGSDKPIMDALDMKADLFKEGAHRYHEGVATGHVTEECVEMNGLLQEGIQKAMITLYVESLLTGNTELEDWIMENFADDIIEAWTNGTLFAIFQWIEDTFGSNEAEEAGV